MADRPRRSLMFNLGAMVGGIVRGFTTPIVRAAGARKGAGGAPGGGASGGVGDGVSGGVGADEARLVRTVVRERVVETPSGPVTLRRTVVDEVVPPMRGDGGG